MEETEKRINSSIKRKHATRIAAVQCVYARRFAASPTMATLIAWQMEQSDSSALEPLLPVPLERKLLEMIACGVQEHHEALDTHLSRILTERWTGSRMSRLMRAIFRCALYELLFVPSLHTHIIIDQYVGVADAFLDDNDVRFVNGVLLEISRDVRADDVRTPSAAT